MLENNKKEQLIGSILDELKELELLTQGMQDPRMLQELAIKKAQHLLANYEQLKEVDNTPVAVMQPKVETVHEGKQVVEAAETAKPVETVTEKESPTEQQTVAQAPFEEKVPQQVAEKESEQAPVVKHEVKEAPQNEVKPQPSVKESVGQTNNDKYKSTSNTTAGIKNAQVKRVDSIFVKSLKSALKLNDRIRYSRELFGGSTELLNSTIEELDQKNNLGEALAYINAQFNWDKDNEAVIEFLSLLERRF